MIYLLLIPAIFLGIIVLLAYGLDRLYSSSWLSQVADNLLKKVRPR